jgi:hypothetical protein
MGSGYIQGETNQSRFAKSKKQTDRKYQSGVAKSVSGYCQLTEIAASLRDS